jgi:hypothetical protein
VKFVNIVINEDPVTAFPAGFFRVTLKFSLKDGKNFEIIVLVEVIYARKKKN